MRLLNNQRACHTADTPVSYRYDYSDLFVNLATSTDANVDAGIARLAAS